jgi:hypothetical protein
MHPDEPWDLREPEGRIMGDFKASQVKVKSFAYGVSALRSCRRSLTIKYNRRKEIQYRERGVVIEARHESHKEKSEKHDPSTTPPDRRTLPICSTVHVSVSVPSCTCAGYKFGEKGL